MAIHGWFRRSHGLPHFCHCEERMQRGNRNGPNIKNYFIYFRLLPVEFIQYIVFIVSIVFIVFIPIYQLRNWWHFYNGLPWYAGVLPGRTGFKMTSCDASHMI
ncbi:MAG: hypothetical protein JWP79_2347 [Polaromonas sp.]|nr:hypothetical protein [Polaromonas sp.]